ncbi:uncharacterized protein LOC125672679 isoform X2 [Ostrea edulis]|uniref:uncharacterized protein LOC125672679 isoform X2 n=1 Tax=Ostrea edulis TaxID=37623 RepID=UPI0024AECCDC|nr:uncharacterized protein LOC125672679 isoform X2 [Ostrea edulis]
MGVFYCHIFSVYTLCVILIMGVSLVYSSTSTAQMSTVGQYTLQYWYRSNLSEDNGDCGEFSANVSRIMETCRTENYSKSCNVYTNPEDHGILLCIKTEGSSQCIDIRCNSTFKREKDFNPEEIIDTDTSGPSCVSKYATIEPKDCVTNSSDGGTPDIL